MVQRYSNNGFCVADADGSYVKYEDYEELERNLMNSWRGVCGYSMTLSAF